MVSDLLLADYYKVLHFFRLLSPFKRFRHYMMSWVICRQGWRSAELRNCAFLASDILKVRQIDIFFVILQLPGHHESVSMNHARGFSI